MFILKLCCRILQIQQYIDYVGSKLHKVGQLLGWQLATMAIPAKQLCHWSCFMGIWLTAWLNVALQLRLAIWWFQCP